MRQLLTADPSSYAGDSFAEDVRAILVRNGKGRRGSSSKELLEVFEDAWKSQYLAESSGIAGRAVGGRAKRQKEFTEREREQMVNRFVGLSQKGLVEALHVLKRAQPELDFGLEPLKITVPFDGLSKDALVALDLFLRKAH